LTNRRRSWQRKNKLSKEDQRGLRQKGKQKIKQITKEKSTSKGQKAKEQREKGKKTRKRARQEKLLQGKGGLRGQVGLTKLYRYPLTTRGMPYGLLRMT